MSLFHAFLYGLIVSRQTHGVLEQLLDTEGVVLDLINDGLRWGSHHDSEVEAKSMDVFHQIAQAQLVIRSVLQLRDTTLRASELLSQIALRKPLRSAQRKQVFNELPLLDVLLELGLKLAIGGNIAK